VDNINIKLGPRQGRIYTNLHKDVPISIIIKDVRVKNLKLWRFATTSRVLAHELLIGIRSLRILVEELHIRMRWSGVQVVIELFDVFTVVTLVAGDTKKALFEDRIFTVPKRKRDAKALMCIRKTSNAILTPTIST
jgi:hypothetical protein